LTGGFICVIPTALAIAPPAAIELLEQNQNQLAKKLILPTLLDHDTASLVMRSATCCQTFMLLLLSRQRTVEMIYVRYGLTRMPRALTTVPKPSSMT
jgi:hypothetical protein